MIRAQKDEKSFCCQLSKHECFFQFKSIIHDAFMFDATHIPVT